MNLTELLDVTASRWPQKPALIEGGNIVSYEGLVRKIAELASQLQALRIQPGCRVGLCLPNSISYVALTFALWRVNAVVVPIPTECTDEESLDIAATMRLEAIISQKPHGQSVSLSPDLFFTKLSPASPPDSHGLNIAFIRFTSGTTSARKGVVLSHETIRDRVVAANKSLGINSDDTVMWCLPMSHHFLVTIVLYLSAGATIVLARHVLARPFLDAVNKWQGTVLYAAPFHYALLARDNSEMKISSVRLAVATTCSLPQDVAENFHQRFGLRLTPALGVIELGLVCMNDDPAARAESVGRPQPDYAVHIRNPDTDGYGEIVFAGPGFFDAYDNPWTPREQLMPDGWFATGDIGRIDAQGYLFLAGRKVAVINLAGRKVFPEEIETVLNRHPDVRESRVFGATHPHLGETVEAEIVLHQPDAGLDSLRTFCRDHLASYKIPTRFTIVSALPRTPVTGKI
ncbi:MAG TPA: class I adenylate-forming enzyme family protein, partial [Dongiaceae bacterium]|nr:class I adenylate-forming enzyme family protein [Dongiaceae bacterium]